MTASDVAGAAVPRQDEELVEGICSTFLGNSRHEHLLAANKAHFRIINAIIVDQVLVEFDGAASRILLLVYLGVVQMVLGADLILHNLSLLFFTGAESLQEAELLLEYV